MCRREEDEEIEKRIAFEITVDACDSYEQIMGWVSYLDDELSFPFQAECRLERRSSPLKMAEQVMVKGVASEDDCEVEMMAVILWQGRELEVPLIQLKALEVSESTQRALADWAYWLERDYQF